MSALTVEAVYKQYPGHGDNDAAVVALKDVSFKVESKEFCSVLGHSGCGKTTLLAMIAGFELPSSGRLSIEGAEIGAPNWQRTVIFQDYALFPWMTVYGNIAFGLEMKKASKAERERLVRSYIELVGLRGFENRYPHQLSGGMKQRVSIARALVVDPTVLLMDEPFAALDAQNRTAMQAEMVRIWERERKTVVLVTHSIEEAITLSDRIIVLSERPGTVVANIKIDLPRPRSEDDPGVVSLKKRLRALINPTRATS